jgi:hypothetical protein
VQVKLDIGGLAGKKGRCYAGIEYVYWNNKFGIDHIDERNLNLLLKIHFH